MLYFKQYKNKQFERINKLENIAKTWVGTSWFHMGASRGGVDCCKFVGLLLVELGILSGIEKEYYGRDWYIHGKTEIVINSLLRHAQNLQSGIRLDQYEYKKNRLYPGDCIAFAMNRRSGLSNHLALYLPRNRIVHCIERRGVEIRDFGYSLENRAKYIFRLLEVEEN